MAKPSRNATIALEATKYKPPNTPIKPPTMGKSHMFEAVVKIKSSFPPTGMIVKKDSKSQIGRAHV